jgi:hypothetical protein
MTTPETGEYRVRRHHYDDYALAGERENGQE